MTRSHESKNQPDPSYWKPYLRGVLVLVGVGRGSSVPAAVVVVSLIGPDVDGRSVLFSPLDIL